MNSDEENEPPPPPEVMMEAPPDNLMKISQTSKGKQKLVDSTNFCYVFHRKLASSNGVNLTSWRLDNFQDLNIRLNMEA